MVHCVQCVPEKRDQKYFLHNFSKFARIVIIFGKQHREYTGKY